MLIVALLRGAFIALRLRQMGRGPRRVEGMQGAVPESPRAGRSERGSCEAVYRGAVHGDESAAIPACPVCRSPLSKGTDLYTKVFRPMTVRDQYCIVFGCPKCYSPVPVQKTLEAQNERRCPVCHKPVAPDGYLCARLFNKTKSGKPHITVTGCPNCAKMQV